MDVKLNAILRLQGLQDLFYNILLQCSIDENSFLQWQRAGTFYDEGAMLTGVPGAPLTLCPALVQFVLQKVN